MTWLDKVGVWFETSGIACNKRTGIVIRASSGNVYGLRRREIYEYEKCSAVDV